MEQSILKEDHSLHEREAFEELLARRFHLYYGVVVVVALISDC